MKLESFKDKKETRRKMMLISLGVITIVGVSLLLYKTFASFSKEVSFRVMSGKVNYYGNADIIFTFYNGDQELDEMPQKGNPDNLVFDHGTCNNGASIEWNEEKWAPLVKSLTTTKTRCTLYFAEKKEIHLDKDIPLAKEGEDGLYAVEHSLSGWNKTEYRYAGVNPDNYVKFNNEKWRIIGLVNVQTENGVEQRIKIIRTDGIENQKDFGEYPWSKSSNSWLRSTLKDMLNGIYYNSGNGECYTGSSPGAVSQRTCDFSGSGELPKGLDDTARKMIDSEVIWNIGGTNYIEEALVENWYKLERGTASQPNAWTKENDGEYHNGIGLMYASDYGYATNGGEIGRESCFKKELRNWNSSNYQTNCANNDWLKPNSGISSSYTITKDTSYSGYAYYVGFYGYISSYVVTSNELVWPTVYLTSSTTIYAGDGSINNPFRLSVNE